MSKDRLLSDEELEYKLFDLAVRNVTNNETGKEYYALDPFEIIDLINTQKRLYAEMVVGLDDTKPSGLIANSTARNQLRAEQRARIK